MARVSTFLFALLASVMIGSSTYAADPIVIRFSHVAAPDSPKGRAALRFKARAEQRTNGQVRVEVYPNASLFKDEDELSALRAGKVEMLAPALGDFGELQIPAFEVFGLPYVFLGRDMVQRVTQGPVGRQIFRELEPKGIVGLAYWDAGFKIFAANKPIPRPRDVKGLRMRMSAKVYKPMFDALGARPYEMGFGATVVALKEGRVDGNENTPSNLYTKKMHELQPYMTVTDHVYLGYAVIANKKFWDSVPHTIRIQLKLAVIDATRYANLYSRKLNEDALNAMKASGKTKIYVPSIDELSRWRRTLHATHKRFESRPGGERLLRAIYAEGAALGYRY